VTGVQTCALPILDHSRRSGQWKRLDVVCSWSQLSYQA